VLSLAAHENALSLAREPVEVREHGGDELLSPWVLCDQRATEEGKKIAALSAASCQFDAGAAARRASNSACVARNACSLAATSANRRRKSGCRFRREARARERHRHATVDSLKALDPNRPIREADSLCLINVNNRIKITDAGRAALAPG